ncbi:hypothetical protein [Glutamicibacter ardleyensis]|uniref:hypothetical protein n=1 Tax=Glutamicibacter ardleyensis TaxID=225894 RepID=UPI003FD1CEE8
MMRFNPGHAVNTVMLEAPRTVQGKEIAWQILNVLTNNNELDFAHGSQLGQQRARLLIDELRTAKHDNRWTTLLVQDPTQRVN